MKHLFYSAVMLLGSWVGLTSCNQADSPALPVYLKLEGARVKIGEGNFTSSVAIKDFWISHNANNLGVHNVPRVIPLMLEEGENKILISGGVFENGLSSIRTPYPFLRNVSLDVDVEPLDTLRIFPTFEYLSTDTVINIIFDEGFELPGTIFSSIISGSEVTELLRRPGVGFQGDFGGIINFTTSKYKVETIISPAVPLPQIGGNDIWMEITYKNDVPFTTGLLYAVPTTGETGDLNSGVFFRSPDKWNTAYIHVNQQVRNIIGSAQFTPYIRATGEDPDSGAITTGTIRIDNIRILHFR